MRENFGWVDCYIPVKRYREINNKQVFFSLIVDVSQKLEVSNCDKNQRLIRFKRYCHWIDFGLEEINKVNSFNINFNKKICSESYFNFYFKNDEIIEEIKRDIIVIIDLYKKGCFCYLN